MHILITGGAGFIGTNLALELAADGHAVTILDNFYRPTSRLNAVFLQQQSKQVQFVEGSVTNQALVDELVAKADAVFHLAAQVAVTTSLVDPQMDFDTNVRGSFAVLEAVRRLNPTIPVLYSSTNKVYGDLVGRTIDRRQGVAEDMPIDLYSPYGCSKGAADLYFVDYSRSFGLKTVVFRQSCIYGEHQYGVEDQGWLAFFVLQYLRKQPITIYGTGEQVRDLLHVKDLVQLYTEALKNIDVVKGEVFNVGGGVTNATSVNKALATIKDLVGHETAISHQEQRLGDQDYFVADVRKAKKLLQWQPTINYQTGLKDLVAWCKSVASNV